MKFSVRVENRDHSSRMFSLAVLVLSIAVGLFLAGILFLFKGINPFYAIGKIFTGSFGSLFGIKSTIAKAIPLILIGGGLCIAYRAKFWSIGAESQLLMGAIFSTWFALGIGAGLPAPLSVIGLFLFGALGGALWGIIPAIFKTKFGVNEVISTLMLNYIAAEFLRMLILGPWKGKTQHGYPYTDDFSSSFVLGLIPGTRIHYVTLILGIILAAVLFFVLFRTTFGYESRVIGENHEAARYAGINYSRTVIIIMAVSGGMAGLAGAGEVGGVHHHLSYPEAISGGYGFTGIIVAWIAQLNPLSVIFAAFFFAGIVIGGDAIQLSLALPASTIQIFNGIILMCLIAGDYFTKHRLRLVIEPSGKGAK